MIYVDKGCCPLLLLFLSYSSFERLSLHPILSQHWSCCVSGQVLLVPLEINTFASHKKKKKKSWDISIRHQNDKAATVVLLKFPIWLVHINTHWTFWLLDSWFSNAWHSFTWWFFRDFAASVAFPRSWHWKPGSSPIHLVRNPAVFLTVGPAQILRKDIYHNCCKLCLWCLRESGCVFIFKKYSLVQMLTTYSLSEPGLACLGSSGKKKEKKTKIINNWAKTTKFYPQIRISK